VTITSIEEMKNISHDLVSYTQQCNPYIEDTTNGTITHQNCTTVPVPYISWYPDYKPAKMFLINGKSSTQKTETINIGKGETKRFRVCVKVPFGSSGKFDIGVYDTNDQTLTLLDPWWNSTWRTNTPVYLNETTGYARTDYPLTFTLSGGRVDGTRCTEEMRFLQNISGSDVEITKLETVSNTSTSCTMLINVNITANWNTTQHGIFGWFYYDNEVSTDPGYTANDTIAVNKTGAVTLIDDGFQMLTTNAAYVHPFERTSQKTWETTFNLTSVDGKAGSSGIFQIFNDSVVLGAAIASWTDYVKFDCIFDANDAKYYGCRRWLVGGGSEWTQSDNTWGAGVEQLTVGVGKKIVIKITGNATAWRLESWNSTGVFFNTTSERSAVKHVASDDKWVYGAGFNTGATRNTLNYTHIALDPPETGLGAESTLEEVITITIHNPTDAQHFVNNTVLFNFTVVSTKRTTINTTISLNGTLYTYANVTNSTPYSLYINVSRGRQVFDVLANTTNKSVSCYTIYDNVTNTSYTTPVYEATNQTFNISITSPFTISNAQLIWNSTQYAATQQNSTSWYRVLALPVVSVNNTNVTWYWNYTVGAPAPYQNTSASYVQKVLWAYVTNTTSKDKSSYHEGETMTFYTYFKNLTATNANLNVRVTFNGTVYNATYHNYSQGNYIYKSIITAPRVPSDNYTHNFTHNITISAVGASRDLNMSANVTIRKLMLDNCTAYSTQFLKLVTYDEETNTQLSNIDYDVYITWWKDVSVVVRNYSLSATNITNATFCVSPAFANFTVNMTASYQDNLELYSVRSWYYVDEPMSNTSKTQRIYLLNATNDYYVGIGVTDAYGVEEEGILVKMQRFFYGGGVWREVQVGLTDQTGASSVYLVQYDVPYRFALYRGQTRIRTYTERTISSSPLSLKTAAETVTTYNYWFGVRVDCSFDNSTKILTCAVSDPTSAVSGWRLRVYEQGLVDPEVYCDNVLSGVSGTLTCDVSSYNTTGIFWTVYMTIDGFDYRVVTDSAMISYPTATWGDTGALVAMMIVLMAGAIGMWNPAVGMVMVFSGVALGSWAGLFPISPPVLIALAAVVALMIYRMKA